MNDLKLLTAFEKKLEINDFLELISFDINMGTVYATDHNKIYCIDSFNMKEIKYFDLNINRVSDSKENKLISLQFLTESNNIALINTKGDLFLLNILTSQFEGVGMITDGISAAQWSPDQELLVLLTISNGLILMTKDFDILNEQLISVRNKVELEYVNVGWGSFETQFKGSAGKNYVKEKGEDMLLDWDQKKGSISWRSDGEYFVVNFIDSEAECRKFQVFNRESVLYSTVENDINVLDSPITWKFSKSLIASSIYRFKKHEIVFFERNGLVHGGFPLPFAFNTMKVKEILWNLDSSILCVWSEKTDSESNKYDFVQSVVQLWTMTNYYWYLKQSYNFEMSNKVTALSWDPEDSNGLHLFTCNGQYIKYKLAMTTHFCTPALDYNASIAVIDGLNVLITPLKKTIIPPPMSLLKVVCTSPVNKIAWSSYNMDILIYCMTGELFYHKYTNNNQVDSYIPFEVRYHIKGLKNYSGSVQHILWTDINELVVIADVFDNDLNLVSFKFESNKDKDKTFELTEKNRIKLNFPVLNVSYNRAAKKIAIQYSSGFVIKYDSELNYLDEFHFPQPCPTFELISAVDSNNKLQDIYIGLTQYYRLYVNKFEIANNCNSFYIHDEFLLFTDHLNTLKFVHLQRMSESNNKIVHEEAMRKLERGAKLIIAIHSETGCVLQMPRGNLETIHPRTLIISKLKHCIDSISYYTVVNLMRKHRINMNILFDHNPEKFLKNLVEFVKQIDDPTLLNLFLNELNDEDTTQTFYRDHYPQKTTINKDSNSNVLSIKFPKKVDRLCSNLIRICEELNAKKYFLVILTCHAKMKELEKALFKICQLKITDSISIDGGLKHLFYLVDVNEMFDVALGTYDFDIVLMVAEKSQKDPKEYLPFLNDLKKLEVNYRKYKIDCYLKRFKNALQNIVKCGENHYEETLKLIDDNRLYTEGLKHFQPDNEMFKRISRCFASHLLEKKYYEEAALVFFRANVLSESMEAFLKSSNWEMYINVCVKMNITGNEFLQKLNNIIEKLKSEAKLFECSVIYERYLNDSENSILCLIEGCFWQEAITLIHKFNRFDFFETNLLPAIKVNYNDLLQNIKQYQERFNDKLIRLEEVRIETIKRKEREDNEYEEEFRQNDNQSESDVSNSTFDRESSVGSIRSYASTVNTQFSNKSKKNKKKKSVISLKKGSVYEDLALIQDLHETINYSNNMKNSVSSLSNALLLFNMNELCIDLQTKYEILMDSIDKNISNIWDYDKKSLNESRNINYSFNSNNISTDLSKLDIKYRYPPLIFSKRQWKLHFYE